jgi:hypothetical protein
MQGECRRVPCEACPPAAPNAKSPAKERRRRKHDSAAPFAGTFLFSKIRASTEKSLKSGNLARTSRFLP